MQYKYRLFFNPVSTSHDVKLYVTYPDLSLQNEHLPTTLAHCPKFTMQLKTNTYQNFLPGCADPSFTKRGSSFSNHAAITDVAVTPEII
jgi:hypothetical protein